MSDKNETFGTLPREPRSRGSRMRDVLDDIDEAVAEISDEDIETRLRETLRRAGCLCDEKGPA